jgi:hypothetical protein
MKKVSRGRRAGRKEEALGRARFWVPAAAFLLITGAFPALRAMANTAPEVEAKIERSEMTPGMHTFLTFRIEWRESPDAELKITSVTPPESPLLRIVDSRESSSTRLTAEGVYVRKTVRLEYEALAKGRGVLSPAVIEYAEEPALGAKQVKRTAEIPVTVLGPFEFYAKRFWLPAALIGFGSLLAAAFAVAGKRLFRRAAPAAPDFALEDEAIGDIRASRTDYLLGDHRRYYDKMRRIVFSYAQKKFGVSLSGLPAEEATRLAAKRQLPEELAKLCAEWARAKEAVEFMNYRPSRTEQEEMARATERYFRNIRNAEKA